MSGDGVSNTPKKEKQETNADPSKATAGIASDGRSKAPRKGPQETNADVDQALLELFLQHQKEEAQSSTTPDIKSGGNVNINKDGEQKTGDFKLSGVADSSGIRALLVTTGSNWNSGMIQESGDIELNGSDAVENVTHRLSTGNNFNRGKKQVTGKIVISGKEDGKEDGKRGGCSII